MRPTTRTAVTTICSITMCAAALAIAGCSGDGDADTASAPRDDRAAREAGTNAPDLSRLTNPSAPSVRGVGFELADGTRTSMDAYKGKVVLVVNTASKCGLAPQVAELQTLQEANQAKGFTVLAFPSASFNQEPLSSAEAAGYCADMGATYPVAAKIDVKGQDAHPLYAALAKQGGEPNWNYTKYLVDQHGNVVARFDPRTSPTHPAVQAAIDRALKG